MGQFNHKTKTSHTTTSQAAIISVAILSSCTILSGMILSSSTTHADTVTSNVTVNVNMSCTMSAAPGTGGTATTDGYSGDSYDTPTNTQLISSNPSVANIPTGTATSGGTSNWAFKLINSGTYSPTIISPYNNYANIPGDDFVKVANYIPGTTGSASSSSVQAKYQVYVTSTQPVGTYTGKVKYTMVYPNDAPAPSTKLLLYDTVASMSKGTQTLAQLRADIVTPTQSDPISSNSGVYEYDTSVFGAASDAASTSKIYYYRGILDSYSNMGTYGSDGLADAYPNHVKLSNNTCWRIVRTTGSGGVKMIYNGVYGATKSGSCANSGNNVILPKTYLNRRSTSSTDDYDTKGRIIYQGYNFSSTASHQTDTSAIANSTLLVNGTKSNLRTQIESWYNSNMANYASKLEVSAGWCNDRTTYSGTTTSTKTTSNVPYEASSTAVYFGAYLRTRTTNANPTLGCPNDTGEDLLTASSGLGVPSAPLTADEAIFAGSGYRSSITPYHANSYLRNGVNGFWLLSPSHRTGQNWVSYLNSAGPIGGTIPSNEIGVRPAISLKPGTTAVSGTGTATDPWIVNP